MRQVLSLSLPEKTAKKIKSLSSKRGFSSVSGYVQHLISLDEELISEKDLLQTIKDSRIEHKEGQVIEANSIADLL